MVVVVVVVVGKGGQGGRIARSAYLVLAHSIPSSTAHTHTHTHGDMGARLKPVACG